MPYECIFVIPARNEEKSIVETVNRVSAAMEQAFDSFKVVVVDASSTDSTPQILERLARENSRLDVISGTRPHQKGFDIHNAFMKYDSSIYGFLDSDTPEMSQYILPAANLIKGGYDIVIGSRYKGGAKLDRPKSRVVVSGLYNKTINAIFGDGILDHQCGFKLFSKNAWAAISPLAREKKWPWDTEVLLIARGMGMKIYEMPISWRDSRGRTPIENISRVLSDASIFIPATLRFIYRFKILHRLSKA
ncbi:MAG: glycosyltransferase [Candidatus Micrarchaeales archaeon]|jgi:Glycosyltransferases involved in cell wall biogenesis|uniref:Glycosyl transferase family 2 n=1 Tax=Candidatus Micrarchaeum acidiphilum ARMAN-2 TaxID=425595 RepID=C7DGV3_MICA2|nr:MAG: glycosyl transferase family 2 [Candidatus Micrarchaeum acidiphilum ARMAN-2]MCW6161498.1 glycosyltransferase [Candidatus Micrarchaeales archaeon]